MQDAYLHALYRQLGINSTYVPPFKDGNEKYVTDANVDNLRKQELVHRQQEQQKIEINSRPPKPQNPAPLPLPKETLLPKNLITVIETTSNSNKLDLSTTLAVAAGVFPSKGRWIERVDAKNELIFEDSVRRTASSIHGDVEIQRLSLPLGQKCKGGIDHETELVEALVPEECFHVDSPSMTPVDPKIMEKCRNEVHIAEVSTSWTCGAKCGRDQNNGYTLYPNRFFVNITSHIEWYISRGVDITVVLLMRDHSIYMKEKLKDDCPIAEVAEKEDELALEIKKEAYEKYGRHGSLLKSGDKERVIAVSYEGLLEMKETYLFDLYQQLGINSTYAPTFIDGNAIYVANPVAKAALKKTSLRHKKRHEKTKASPLHFLPW
ncbi:hypothetical protein ACHAXR_004312 [Thalassiosira sp. AJA248-18]